MRLTFWGAAGGHVTGSMHLLEAAGARILLDAGMFQGHRAEARQLNTDLPFDPRVIDAIVVSHAHIDHTGRLPLLVNRGFHNPIYVTPATRDVLEFATIQGASSAGKPTRTRRNPPSSVMAISAPTPSTCPWTT